jgi:hypothetical protein
VFVTLPSLAGLTAAAADEPGFTLNVCHPLDGWTVAPAAPAMLRSVPFFPEPPRIQFESISQFTSPNVVEPSLKPPVPPPEPRV